MTVYKLPPALKQPAVAPEIIRPRASTVVIVREKDSYTVDEIIAELLERSSNDLDKIAQACDYELGLRATFADMGAK